MASFVDHDSPARIRAGHFAGLLAIPAIALAVMVGHTFAPATKETGPEPRVAAALNQELNEPFTLYIFAGETARAALHEAQSLPDFSVGHRPPGWYALVDTPAEESQLMKAWDDANWVRSDLGLGPIKLVDLRSR